MESFSFYAETSTGHIIKGLAEILNNSLSNEFCMTIKNSGIFSESADSRETKLFNIELMMGNFDQYICTEERTIAFSLKAFQKFLKRIKKKDSLVLFIEKDKKNKLGTRVVTNSNNKNSDCVTKNYLAIRDAKPDKYDFEIDYHFPKVIPTGEFQKIFKDMAYVPSKEVEIKIQNSKYVSFSCDGGEMMESNTEFGTMDDSDCYKNIFYIETLSQLTKLTGLSPKMQICAPKDFKQPIIKLKIPAGQLGSIEIIVKSKYLIDTDTEEKNKIR